MRTRELLYNYLTERIQAFTTDTYPPDHIWRLLDEGQREIVKRTGCYTSSGSVTTVDGTQEYAMSTDIMICENCIQRVYFYDASATTYTELFPTTWDEARTHESVATETEGTPEHYWIRFDSGALKMGFTPTPDTSSDTVTYHYTKTPPDLTVSGGAIVVPAGWERLICDWALVQALYEDKKFKEADRLKQIYDKELVELQNTVRRMDKSRSAMMRPGTKDYSNRRMDLPSRRYGRN